MRGGSKLVNPHPSVHQQEVQLWNYSSNRVNWNWKNIITLWKLWPEFRIQERSETRNCGIRGRKWSKEDEDTSINKVTHLCDSLMSSWRKYSYLIASSCVSSVWQQIAVHFCIASQSQRRHLFQPSYRRHGWVSAHIQNEILYSWWAQSLVSLLLMEQHTTTAIILTCSLNLWARLWSSCWLFGCWQFY